MQTPTMQTRELKLQPYDLERLFRVCGKENEYINYISKQLGVTISQRGNHFHITGKNASVSRARNLLVELYDKAQNKALTLEDVHTQLKLTTHDSEFSTSQSNNIALKTNKGYITPRSENQAIYISNILHHDINFGVGPAGTGKTWLAMACAVDALLHEDVDRILLVRPAVEAGEKLGFLPGDMEEKINPYLRPLFDALHDMMSAEKVNKLLETNIIEIAPLAFMRGRTLNNTFVILDESQNTTASQMKMFLTRIGFGSKTIITGDPSQIDLQRGIESGLVQALEILSDIDGISTTFFGSEDVVRHDLVQKIIDAYESHSSHNDYRQNWRSNQSSIHNRSNNKK